MEKKQSVFIGILSIILISCCLRAPITGIGPLVTTIRDSLGLNATVAGLLTTIPLLAFAAVSFATSALSRKIGAGRLMMISLFVLLAGLLVRSFLGTPGLFIGTVIIGLGIGVNNTLLPAVIVIRYPEKIGAITGIYTTFMAGFASISSGISVPLSLAITWKNAILVWSVLVVLAIIFWVPNTSLKLSDRPVAQANVKRRPVTSSAITWYITLFMGLASLMFYFTVAWYSTILQSHGYDQVTSGLYNMIMMLCGLPGSFLMPIIASKTKHQSMWGAFIGVLFVIGTVSLIWAYSPFFLIVSIIAMGFSTGGAIAYAMVLFGLHTTNAEDASSLSSFAQGVGYIMAAVGPVLVGKIFDAAGNWITPLIVITVLAVASTVFGWLSGLDRKVDTSPKS